MMSLAAEMPISLTDLPSELLAHIVSYAENLRTLSCLALTCRKLHEYIDSNDSYRAFVQSRYPSYHIPPSWKQAAHGLTTLSRALDRKSIVARCIRPPPDPNQPRPRGQPRRPRGQTMGYQPVIDSYESWTGSDWTSRRQVLAWGAGAELVVRVTWMGKGLQEEWQAARRNPQRLKEFDQHRHRSRWWRILGPWHRDGPDDITAIKILRDPHRPRSHCEYVIIGRANGELDMISIDHNARDAWKRETCFIGEGQHFIRSISVSPAEQPLLAACINELTIAIYSIPTGRACAGRDGELPLGKIQLDSPGDSCRAWLVVFLRQNLLAVSVGPSIEPIRIFDARPGAISSHPLRTLSIHEKWMEGVTTIPRGTVNALVPLPQSSPVVGEEGDLFLSGGYDGTVR